MTMIMAMTKIVTALPSTVILNDNDNGHDKNSDSAAINSNT